MLRRIGGCIGVSRRRKTTRNNITCVHIINPPEDDIDQEFTCEICFQHSLPANKKFSNGDKCGHPFCTDCTAKYIRDKLEDERTGDIKCPAWYCNHKLDHIACHPLVERSLFLRWCKIMGRETCYCPHKDCNVLILNECGGVLRRSTCPKCNGSFCFRCKRVWQGQWHITCRDNDEKFRRLAARKGWRKCPSCGIFVERVGGCSLITCRCGTIFSYRCGRVIHIRAIVNPARQCSSSLLLLLQL